MKNVIIAMVVCVCMFGSASAQAQGQGTVGNGPKAPCTIEEYTGVKQELAAARAYIKALPDLCKPDKDGNVRVISGTPGQRGTDGKPGVQGRDGSDGKSPEVSMIEMSDSAHCSGRGGVKVMAPNGALALFICNGEVGVDGKSVTVEPEPAGIACPNGGVKFSSSDGVAPSYACNGKDGADGKDGISCWDLNENGLNDLDSEDLNDDSRVDVQDCIPEAPRASDALTFSAGLGTDIAFRGPTPSYEGHILVGLTGWMWDHLIGLGAFGSGGVFNTTATGTGWTVGGEIGPVIAFDRAAEHQVMMAFAATQYSRTEAELGGLSGNGLGYRLGGKFRYNWSGLSPLVVSLFAEIGYGHVSGYNERTADPFDRPAVQGTLGLDLMLAAGLL